MREKKTFDLSAGSIDQVSELAAALFAKNGADREDVVRIRLSVEESLLAWAKILGDTTRCDCVCGVRFGRAFLTLTVPGARVDPRAQEDALFSDSHAANNLLEALGISPAYSYVNGQNTIVFTEKKKPGGIVKTVIAPIVLAVALGLVARLLPSDTVSFLSESVLSPLLSAFLRCLKTIAGPLMFLSIVQSIYNIGDLATFGRIGKGLIGSLMFGLLICTIGALLMNVWLYPVSLSGISYGGESAVGAIWDMLLDTVPANIVEPFSTGNIMQIVFLAGGIGLAMLALSTKVSAIATIIKQSNLIVSLLMNCVSMLVPLYIFISVLNMVCFGTTGGLYSAAHFLAECLLTWALLGGSLLILCSLKLRRSPGSVFRSVLPTFLISLSTASSAAAYTANVDNCIHGLGIDEKLVHFGVPLGMAIFKAGAGSLCIILSLFMAKLYGLPINLSFLVSASLLSFILSVASPLCPGGLLTVFIVLFTQLGIPAEALTLAAALNALLDFPLTAINNLCLQMQLGIVAKRLNLINNGKPTR